MNTSFQFIALSSEQFAPLFGLGDRELKAMGARRMVADEKPGFPCRVSLVDAEIGETVLLVPFTHHDVASPYRASGPVFIRSKAKTAVPAPGEIPEMFRHRLLSIRGYDTEGMLAGADIAKGDELAKVIDRFFGNEAVSYLHIHNARPGCYNCAVRRA